MSIVSIFGRYRRCAFYARAVALAVVLVMASGLDAGAGQDVVAPLPQSTAEAPPPQSTAQAPQQCCRVCSKGKPCGDACISAAKQCRKAQGCACSAASGS
jgi:hypothetical protein